VLRNVGAIVAGLVVGMVVNLAIVQVNTAFFPLPEGVDLTDTNAMRDAVQALPAASWILVFVAHIGQAFVGGWVAARLSVSELLRNALIVGILSMAAGIANAVMLSAPAWTWIEMPFYPAAAWVAGRMAISQRQGTA